MWYMVFSLIRIQVIIKREVRRRREVLMLSIEKPLILKVRLFIVELLVSNKRISFFSCLLCACNVVVCISIISMAIFLIPFISSFFELGSIIMEIRVIIMLLMVCSRFMLSGSSSNLFLIGIFFKLQIDYKQQIFLLYGGRHRSGLFLSYVYLVSVLMCVILSSRVGEFFVEVVRIFL